MIPEVAGMHAFQPKSRVRCQSIMDLTPRHMMLRILLLCMALLPGCADDAKKDPVDTAMERAAIYCASSSGQLVWLKTLMEKSHNDPNLAGRIYTFQSNGRTVFMHQPWIMSCMGCILYDCQGNRLEPDDIDQAILANGFQDLTIIYDPPI